MAPKIDPIHPLITDYCESLYDAQMATKRIRRADIRVICRTWAERHGSQLDPTTFTDVQARAIMADLAAIDGRGAVSIERIIQTGRSCWRWLMEAGLATTNPFAALPLRDARERRRHKKRAPGSRVALTVMRELLRFDELKHHRTMDLVLHFLQAGIRPLEITGIQAEDIDRATGSITVRNTYGNVRRTVPLTAEARAAIDAYCQAVEPPTTPHTPLIGQYRGEHWRGLSISTLQRRFRELCEQAAAQLNMACADTSHPLARMALQHMAENIADIEMDQLRW